MNGRRVWDLVWDRDGWPRPLRWFMNLATVYLVVHMLWTGQWIKLLVLTAIGAFVGIAVAVVEHIYWERKIEELEKEIERDLES